MKMHDYFGKEIEVGDHIVVAKHGRTSVSLKDGIVVNRTESSLIVECKTKPNNQPYTLRVYSSGNCIIIEKGYKITWL